LTISKRYGIIALSVRERGNKMELLIMGFVVVFFGIGLIVCPLADKDERKRIVHKWRGYK